MWGNVETGDPKIFKTLRSDDTNRIRFDTNEAGRVGSKNKTPTRLIFVLHTKSILNVNPLVGSSSISILRP